MEQPKPVISPIVGLLHSRKFLVLLLDTIVSLFLYYQLADPELIALIQPVFLTLIASIAYEDGQGLRAAGHAQAPSTVINNMGPADTIEAPQ